MSKIPELIAAIPLFASLPRAEIERLAENLRAFEVPENTLIFREGNRDNRFYILVDGQVEIIKALGEEGERLLAVRDKGSFLGEMSLFSQEGTHTASVRAHTPLKVLEMTRSEFDDLLHRQPNLVYELVRLLSKRLDESENSTILDLTEKNRQLTQAYQELKAAHALIVEKEKLEHELEIARQIQNSFLPGVMPEHPAFDFGALMVPAHAVGGDFYDLIPLGDNRFGIVVGDVSDKGMPAALFMALTFSLLRAEAVRGEPPIQTLLAVNRHLLNVNVTNMFVTVLFGILDCDHCTFEYVRAGHPHPLILDDRGVEIQLPSGLGQSIGIFEDPVFDQNRVSLPPAGMVLVFSDGLSEATNEKGEAVIEHLPEILLTAWDQPAQKICDHLWESVSHISASQEQLDDFTLVCVRWGR